MALAGSPVPATTREPDVRIAVIGAGRIGGALGRAFARAGHDVVFGTRAQPGAQSPGGDGTAAADVPTALAGTVDAVVLALPAAGVSALIDEHAASLAGKLVVDATNNMSGNGPANAHGYISQKVEGVRYARAFNNLGFENLENPHFGTEVADMFFSAPDQDVPLVGELIEAVGLRPVHVGADSQDVVDGLLYLWFQLSKTQGRHLAFKMLSDNA